MKRQYKQIILFLAVISIIATVTCASAADFSDENLTASPETYISPSAGDMADGSSKNPYNNLKDAINHASNDSTIYLDEGVYKGENNRNITLDKAITLIGKSKENTVIDCESTSRLFTMTSNTTLALINLCLKNGNSTNEGGLIYSEGNQIIIKNCILRDSQANPNAGAIYNNLGTLKVEGTSFINNSAFQYGGAIYTAGDADIRNSVFTQNLITADKGVGGCIASGAKLNLEGCTFSRNYAPYSSAGILNLGYATINNCRFEHMKTDYTAGAISNHNYALINNSYFGFNDVKYYAGAILAPPSGHHVITEVYNTIFEANHAGYHRAVANNFKDTELIMHNCAIIDNYIIKDTWYGDIALDDNASLLYCWWGQNNASDHYYSPHDSNYAPEKINVSRWLVMTFTSHNDVYKNRDNAVTVDLNHYFDNETKQIFPMNEKVNLPLEVTVYTASQSMTKKLAGGVATFTVRPGEGDDAVYAKINNQIMKLDVNSRYSTVIANDMIKYYGNGQELSVKLVDCYNNGIAGEKLSVNMDGKTYTGYTNTQGVATFKVKDTPKSYSIKVSYNGNNYFTATSKSVKVKVVNPVIKASKTKIRKKGKFSVTFMDANRKALKHVKVKFKIKGKIYIRTTNSKGQAKITINLKANKKYTVKVGFKSTKTYGTTNLVKKIKVIK